jgi:uncharacterized membrane protein YfcA
MLGAGICGGILAGLLGVGGGIVVVPALEFAFAHLGVDVRIAMHLAVATSMATIIPTSISSARAHAARGSVDLTIVRGWSIAIVLGAVSGAVVAASLDGRVLSLIFGCVALLVAIRLFLPQAGTIRQAVAVPTGLRGAWIPFGIGTLSAMLGIGGGTVSVPVMAFCGVPIHRAVGTAALLGLWISVPATAGFLFARPILEPPKFTIGYVSLLGFALIGLASWFAAPFGSRLAHGLSKVILTRVFGLFLLIAALRMFHRSFG